MIPPNDSLHIRQREVEKMKSTARLTGDKKLWAKAIALENKVKKDKRQHRMDKVKKLFRIYRK